MVANKIPFQLNLDRRDKEVEKAPASASQLKFATLLILFCSLVQCVSIIVPCSKLIKPHIAVN